MWLLLLNVIVMPLGFLLIIYFLNWMGRKKKQKFNMKQKNSWLIAHIFFVILYFGGLLGTFLMVVTTKFTDNRDIIYSAHLFIQYFDWFLIIPGGLGALLTGIWLAVRTHWGLTKHYWLLVKWIGNILAIVFGANFMRIWLHDNFKPVFNNPLHPLENALYLANRNMIFMGLLLSFSILAFLVIISYYKPWGKRKEKEKVNRIKTTGGM
ncbi:DUF2269 family protein [Fictibacillus sp. WQ 8-8]|uniref:DUF2269 family protein n=1 Tax=Fictibacillus sp. WQ 8-8 TaxID=2938788 RepID=UPI00210C0455|nr:DUF2269 family protein [Fictibacillus sp. WQ 8-8]MCQ6268733.1 DUF2269 family protein [Fictibacillus sp. WQ 8-8]